MDLLQYTFFQHALIGSLFICIACGIVGAYIVSRRLVFISGGITHASFGGLGLGFYLGVNPIFSALAFSVASAFGVEWLSKKQGVREDSAIAVFWALGMALGVICIFLTPGYAPNISAYLFGNILTITLSDIWFAGILAVLLIATFILFFNPILYTAFDREFAQTQGVKTNLIEHLMMLAIAVTIVASIRLIGIMLLMSLLTVPQMTANLFTARLKNIIVYSILIGIAGCFSGLFLSYYLNVPSGAAIIFVQVILFLLCKTGIFLCKKTIKHG
ncbi:zinc ABC transporter permease [Bacteroidia bacterium]|nr:zinc ABC transporter permease [Bacteroidia bacterium]GHV72060.1 zinc ABC transporter permease [Bacteroidia bacterium]